MYERTWNGVCGNPRQETSWTPTFEMNEATQPMMRVRDWDRIYENNRSRDMKRTNWFPAPNDLSADSYVELVSNDDGAAHFGVWIALLMVASRTKQRGSLAWEDGRPHTIESLARLTRLPETIVRPAIERLLEIGLLEIGGDKSRRKSKLTPHLSAGIPHDAALSPQVGALEGKGREHHHQEEKGTEKKGTERAREKLKTEDSRASASAAAASSQNGDAADENPKVEYASPEDELKAVYQAKTGEPITSELLRAIRVNLELSGVSLADFVREVRKHTENRWKNPPGFLRDLSKRFHAKTRVAAKPVTATEAALRDYQCPRCFSKKPGEGLRLVNGKPIPCECASPEHIEYLRARDIVAPEDLQ